MMTLDEAIKYCKDVALSCTNRECALEHFQLLKWLQEYSNMLEKQGEQKPTDKVEPKFKVGNWIINKSHDICLITDIDLENGYYICESNRFGNTDGDIDLTDKAFHLWSIKDAKDGDVLADEDNNIGIYRGKVDAVDWLSYIYLGCDNHFYGFNIGGYHNIKNTKPATKEQRDQLEKAMGEVGYDFDFNKKELKKIERIFAEDSCKNSDDIITEEKDRTEYKKGFECGKQRVLKYPEDFGLCKKHAWSEEDEYLLGETIQHLEELIRIEKVKHCGIDVQYYQRDIDWLKSLKERLQIQPKQKR